MGTRVAVSNGIYAGICSVSGIIDVREAAYRFTSGNLQ